MTISDSMPPAGMWVRIKPVAPDVLTAALFALGAFALYHLLRPVNFRDVMDQVRGTPWHIIALALMAMFTGYAALIGYDWSALRYLGKSFPFLLSSQAGFWAMLWEIPSGPAPEPAEQYATVFTPLSD